VPLKLTFELSDPDLAHFRGILAQARERVKGRAEKDLVAGARNLLERVRDSQVPEFVRRRLVALGALIDMLEDDEWRLEGADRERVSSALAYFAEPLDLIPDSVPGLGFLDDAVMVELIVQELRHEIDAYLDFCQFRREEERRRGPEGAPTRAEWLEEQRRQLFLRMRRRRRERRSRRTSQVPLL
jgi:hypothetical protein